MIIVIQNITANTLQQKNQIIAVYSKQRNQQIHNHILWIHDFSANGSQL